jgi:hypothetical protein
MNKNNARPDELCNTTGHIFPLYSKDWRMRLVNLSIVDIIKGKLKAGYADGIPK